MCSRPSARHDALRQRHLAPSVGTPAAPHSASSTILKRAPGLNPRCNQLARPSSHTIQAPSVQLHALLATTSTSATARGHLDDICQRTASYAHRRRAVALTFTPPTTGPVSRCRYSICASNTIDHYTKVAVIAVVTAAGRPTPTNHHHHACPAPSSPYEAFGVSRYWTDFPRPGGMHHTRSLDGQ